MHGQQNIKIAYTYLFIFFSFIPPVSWLVGWLIGWLVG